MEFNKGDRVKLARGVTYEGVAAGMSSCPIGSTGVVSMAPGDQVYVQWDAGVLCENSDGRESSNDFWVDSVCLTYETPLPDLSNPAEVDQWLRSSL